MDSETGPVTISDFLSPDAVVGNFEAGDRVVATGTVAGGDFRADSVQKDK